MNPQPPLPGPTLLAARHCAARAALACSPAVFARANGRQLGAQAIGERRALQALACAEHQAREERLS